MRLYIIRHAETEYNKLGLIQGSEVDSELNEVGIKQSELFYDFYKELDIKKIYVSGLKRTLQTVKRFIDNGIPYEKINDFNEISWGVNQGKNDDLVEYKSLTDSWKNGELDNKFNSGESPNEMVARVMRGVDKIIKENFASEIILVNDGSTDASFEIATTFSNQYNFIKLIKKKAREINHGLSYTTTTNEVIFQKLLLLYLVR